MKKKSKSVIIDISEESYHKRNFPTLYAQEDFTEGSLYIKGDEFDTYHFDYSTVVKIMQRGLINTNKRLFMSNAPLIEMDHSQDATFCLTKATPGPWIIERVEGGGKKGSHGLVYCRIKSKQRTFAYTGVYGPPNEPHITEEEAEANARIIANSRELFDVCVQLLKHKEEGHDTYNKDVVTCAMVEDFLQIHNILEKTK